MTKLNNYNDSFELPVDSGEYVVQVKYGNGTTDNFCMVCSFNAETKSFHVEAQTSNDGGSDYFFRKLMLPVVWWVEIPKLSVVDLSFEHALRPLMYWLAKNKHPHHTVVVTSTAAELLEGVKSYNTNEFLVD